MVDASGDSLHVDPCPQWPHRMTTSSWALAMVVVAIATIVQSATGMGFGLVAVPLLVLVAPTLGVPAVLSLTIIVMIAVAWRERRWLSWPDVGLAAVFALPGVVIGTLILAMLNPRLTHLAVGTIVAASTVASIAGRRFALTRATLAGASLASGLLTPIAALPGPPMAVVYQPDDVRRMRATLSAYFAVVSALTLLGLWWSADGADAVPAGGREVIAGLVLTPAVVVGAVLARPLVLRLPATWVRHGALALSLASGVILIARAIGA